MISFVLAVQFVVSILDRYPLTAISNALVVISAAVYGHKGAFKHASVLEYVFAGRRSVVDCRRLLIEGPER
jgi:hypothetical protein